jgi:hypothetical protein
MGYPSILLGVAIGINAGFSILSDVLGLRLQLISKYIVGLAGRGYHRIPSANVVLTRTNQLYAGGGIHEN